MNASAQRWIQTQVVALAVLMICGTTFAQGTANGPTTSHNVVFNSIPIVYIGDNANPVPIDLDPLGPPWTKLIYDPNGHLFVGGAVGFVETIINVGNEPWYDWHEQILPDLTGNSGGYWTNFLGPGASVNVNGNPISISIAGMGTPNLDLTNFSQPVLPGDVMTITKLAIFSQSVQHLPGGPVMILQEYPTPEPASAALIGMGAMGLMGRGRKNG